MSLYKFTGSWTSERYPNISGVVEIELPFYHTNHFETILTLTYNANGSFRPAQTKSFELQGRFTEDSQGKERYVLMPRELGMGQLFTLTFVQHPDTTYWRGFYTCVYPYDIGQMTLTCTVTCRGCLEEQANQLGHMDYGGCLYDDSDSGSENFDDPPAIDHRSLPTPGSQHYPIRVDSD